MINGAEKVKEKLMDKNEADGPVFKIRNDPRFTRVGSFLCHSGLDELPQILNIVKGDMVFIGPRPLPVDEASQIDDKYRTVRESVLPGLISPWILNGYHKMSFDSWMKSDMEYIEKKTFKGDIFSFFKGAVFVAGLLESELLEK